MEKVKIPYTVTADISKYEGEVFNKVPRWDYLEQKQTEIGRSGFSLNEAKPLIRKFSKYCGLSETDDIREIAFQLEEDIAILHKGKVVSMCFCFPSGFDPAEKVGQSFFELHEPVADNQKLQRASNKVNELISKAGSLYRRHVWTLTSSSKLSRHPFYRESEITPTLEEDLFFRKETQTTVGIDDDTCFFFVKVDVVPFISLDKAAQTKIIDSINTMSDSVLQYKGLTKIKEVLNRVDFIDWDQAYTQYRGVSDLHDFIDWAKQNFKLTPIQRT